MHMHAHTAAVGPQGLSLLATEIESPAADSYRNKHGLSIHLHIYSKIVRGTSFQNRGNDITYWKETKKQYMVADKV